ncbi:hypothetical protein OL548_33500 [Lysinibacillus sp. MHQ-1]|nr:hypothetical protein OL548_33500 [Lysinibacillus sp. MHQ-1]
MKKSASLMSKNCDHYLLCLYNLGVTQFRLEQTEKKYKNLYYSKGRSKKIRKKLSFNLFATFYLYLLGEEKKESDGFF